MGLEHPGKASWVSYLSNTSPKTLWDISLQVGKKGAQNLSYVCLSEGLTPQEGVQQKLYNPCKTWFLSIQFILVQAVEGLKLQLFRTRVETRGLHEALRAEALAFRGGELLYMTATCRAEKVNKSRDPKALAGGSGENWGEQGMMIQIKLELMSVSPSSKEVLGPSQG